jgi:hypothetical protein
VSALVCEIQQETARKSHRLFLRGLRLLGQTRAAEISAVSEGTYSKWLSEGRLESFSSVLAAMDLKIVPATSRCFNPKEIETILWQAQQYLARIGSIDQLQFDDPE